MRLITLQLLLHFGSHCTDGGALTRVDDGSQDGNEKRKRQATHRRARSHCALCRVARSASWAAVWVRTSCAVRGCSFGDVDGAVIISSEQFIVARVPEGAASGEVVVATNGFRSNPRELRLAVPIAENLHPVANPAIDAQGNIYVNILRIARAESSGRHLPYRHELQRQALSARDDERDRAGVRPRRQPVRLVAL